MKNELPIVGDLVEDNYGRLSILTGSAKIPENDWIDAQSDHKICALVNDKYKVNWVNLTPLSGGACCCVRHLLTFVRVATVEDFDEAMKHANYWGKMTLSLLPIARESDNDSPGDFDTYEKILSEIVERTPEN